MRRSIHALLIGALIVAVATTGCSSSGSTSSARKADTSNNTAPPTTLARSATQPKRNIATPTITGPITGPGEPWGAITSTPKDAGYTTAEYFLSGTATAYKTSNKLTANGQWQAQPTTKADYETRIFVHRPTNPAKFNGTVVVEWLNVSAGFETAPDFLFTQRELIRDGYAWVGVSAQKAGIEESDAGGVLGIKPLKGANPKRYAPLHHPGDQYSYDIFSQAAAAVRATGAKSPMGDLKVKHVIGDGESQSAFRMVNYINAVQPVTHAFDGFLVHSRWDKGAPLNPGQHPPENTTLRSDTAVPVLQVQSETDVPMYLKSRQADSTNIRTWEITGTAHVDANVLASALGCSTPVNSGPEIYVMDAALNALNTWITNPAHPPTKAPRITVNANGKIQRDAHGNALGGIRTPQLDVPIATLSGEGGQGSGFCTIAGITKTFPLATATDLYGSKAKYLAAFDTSMQRAIKRGFLLEADATDMHDAASKAWPTS